MRWGSRLLTTGGDVDARLVVDATGRGSRRHAGRPDRLRRGRGRPAVAGVEPGLPTLMDLRPAAERAGASADVPLRRPGRRRLARRGDGAGGAPTCRARGPRRPAGRPHRHPGRASRRARHHRRWRVTAGAAGTGAAFRRRRRLRPSRHRVLRRRLAARRATRRDRHRPRLFASRRGPIRGWSTTPSGRAISAGRAGCTPTGWRCCCDSTRTSWRRSSTPSSICRSTCGRRTCASTRRRARSPGR